MTFEVLKDQVAVTCTSPVHYKQIKLYADKGYSDRAMVVTLSQASWTQFKRDLRNGLLEVV